MTIRSWMKRSNPREARTKRNKTPTDRSGKFMKLPGSIQQLLRQKEASREVFLSLLLSPVSVGALAWSLDEDKNISVMHASVRPSTTDDPEEQTRVADEVITAVEERLPKDAVIDKVILGLSPSYLTDAGDILTQVRPKIKQMTSALDITPIGFVSLHQALVHKLKKEEGVPPSLILLSIEKGDAWVYIYKVGSLKGVKRTAAGSSIAQNLEGVLKEFPDIEVFPSRILLYGDTEEVLEGQKAELLHHPWTTKNNFLHFPKMETVSLEDLLTAVSLAGAGELSSSFGTVVQKEESEKIQPQPASKPEALTDKREENSEEELKIDASDANVELVSPEAFGFQKADILEKPVPSADTNRRNDTPKPGVRFSPAAFLSRMKLPKLGTFRLHIPKFFKPKNALLPVIVAAFLGLLLLFGVWVMPKATVTVFVVAQTVDAQEAVVVLPTATIPDSNTKTIPGRVVEKVVSGEKTVNATGSKEIGDPARGTVTVYNKSETAARTFPKGSVLSKGSLQFTLDEAVTVASATANLADGGATYGKASAAITASQIGTSSNLPAGTEFTFKDFSTSIAVGRNDQPLSGGVSRSVTVVSRKDRDVLVTALTTELVEKAKQELSQTVSGNEKLIAETIKTTVTEQSFAQEIDQEAGQLSGKLTVSVTGTSYSEDELRDILAASSADKVPTGYELLSARSTVRVGVVKVQKDNSISMTADLDGVAVPVVDADVVRTAIAGKSLLAAQEYLKTLPGVGEASFVFRWNVLLGKRLPLRSANISVSVAVRE